MAKKSLYRRLRAFLSPVHPWRLWVRFVQWLQRNGYSHVYIWILALHPRRAWALVRWAGGLAATLRRRRREKRLTVAVDVTALWERPTGIGWYLYRLLENLAERDDVRLRLYGLGVVYRPDVPEPSVPLPSGPAIESVSYRTPPELDFAAHYLASKMLIRLEQLIAADRNEVLFAPNYYLPPGFGRCRGKLVATVHDLSVERVPETMRESTRQELTQHLRRTLERATTVLTDSETVRGELVESGLVPASRVVAVHLGLGAAASAVAADELPAEVPERYLLHVGTLEPRKDLPTFFEALRLARRRGDDPPVLVLCGGLGWKTEEIQREMADGLEGGWVVHLGYQPDEVVAALYRRAVLVVLPSIYEGFGLPALEAMHAGTALLCSDIPVLREIAGEAALYAPPGDPEVWADRLREALCSEEQRVTLGARGRERARRFDWQNTAEATVEVWRAAAGRPSRPAAATGQRGASAS